MSQTTTFSVDGMTCAHCVHHVTTELTAIPGVRDVSIELVNGGSSPVTVVSDEPLTDAAIAAAIDEAGYALTPKGSLL
ncbi:MAG TPA: heavy metal-associated domain-containing protein [Cellulomonas sp.]|uniref:heavy-metal-associated domain-containing protein n=1 Tax=Cellulomonas sp. TaxID=40001 RepID=UPI002E353402|nr:heavy metal-associated domain-containing protein [Cellulomonas sp.]HEX5333732.1 heavy metal-associated domain-containing protein [Cellulomonas sp.]